MYGFYYYNENEIASKKNTLLLLLLQLFPMTNTWSDRNDVLEIFWSFGGLLLFSALLESNS